LNDLRYGQALAVMAVATRVPIKNLNRVSGSSEAASIIVEAIVASISNWNRGGNSIGNLSVVFITELLNLFNVTAITSTNIALHVLKL
jgi:hypothetical protein